MERQNVVYTYNRTLFSLKKEGNPVTCYTEMNLKDIMLREISRH